MTELSTMLQKFKPAVVAPPIPSVELSQVECEAAERREEGEREWGGQHDDAATPCSVSAPSPPHSATSTILPRPQPRRRSSGLDLKQAPLPPRRSSSLDIPTLLSPSLGQTVPYIVSHTRRPSMGQISTPVPAPRRLSFAHDASQTPSPRRSSLDADVQVDPSIGRRLSGPPVQPRQRRSIARDHPAELPPVGI